MSRYLFFNLDGLEPFEKLNFVALFEGDVCLFPTALAPRRLPTAAQLAHVVAGTDRYHRDLEQFLDGAANLVLARLAANSKHHLIGLFGRHRALLGYQRRQNDLIVRHRAMPPLRLSISR